MTRAIVVSDLHLVYNSTEEDAIQRMIAQLERTPPDELIINGDLYELWRRDLSGAQWAASDYTAVLEGLRDVGVDVTYIVGNHDGYLIRHLADDPRYPFDPVLDYETTLDGTPFFFTHGHKYEPLYLPPGDDALALTDDFGGDLADFIWNNRPAPGNPVENAALLLAGPAASYFDPENVGKNDARRRFIEAGIRAERDPGQWGIFGHTHVPYVDQDEQIANSGSFTTGQATYIEIADGAPQLRSLLG